MRFIVVMRLRHRCHITRITLDSENVSHRHLQLIFLLHLKNKHYCLKKHVAAKIDYLDIVRRQLNRKRDAFLSICFGHLGFPSMLEELIAERLKVLCCSFSLMSTSSEFRLNLLSHFMVRLNKVQSFRLDGVFKCQRRRKEGPSMDGEEVYVSSILLLFFKI